MAEAQRIKRKQGRPVGDSGGVGREALIEASIRLLREQAPSRITISSIAREAGVDPALVRYYFGTRTALLTEIVGRITHERRPHLLEDTPPIEALERRIHATFSFTGSARYMHRLILDELSEAGTDESRATLRDLNLGLIAEYAAFKARDGGETLIDFDPLFLNLTVLAVTDFYFSAMPLIELIVPPGTDMAALTARYEAFVVKLFSEGLLKR